MLGAILEEQPEAAVRQRLGHDPQMVAVGQHPFLFEHLLGTAEPALALGLPGGIVASLRNPLVVAHQVEHAFEFGPFAEPLRVKLGHYGKRPVEEAQRPVGIELGSSGGHPVGQLALRFNVADELGAGVLEFLLVDREAGHRAGRQGHVDDLQHAPLAADDRGLQARLNRAGLQRLARRRHRALIALGVDQLGVAGDDVGRVAAFHRSDERAVDQPKLEVGTAVPHREWRRFDQMRE